MVRLVAFSLILIMPFPAMACYFSPDEIRIPATELIARTSNIVVARAVKAEWVEVRKDVGTIQYTFLLKDTLKGKADERFSIHVHGPFARQYDPDLLQEYEGHTDPRFWLDNVGRAGGVEPDCKVHPQFAVGLDYLMFLDKPYHTKGFEIIRFNRNGESKDKWLDFVKREIANQESGRISYD